MTIKQKSFVKYIASDRVPSYRGDVNPSHLTLASYYSEKAPGEEAAPGEASLGEVATENYRKLRKIMYM